MKPPEEKVGAEYSADMDVYQCVNVKKDGKRCTAQIVVIEDVLKHECEGPIIIFVIVEEKDVMNCCIDRTKESETEKAAVCCTVCENAIGYVDGDNYVFYASQLQELWMN